MRERKKVWGLYMWGSNEWWTESGSTRRMRFDTPEQAFEKFEKIITDPLANTEGFTTGIRPFYIVSKSKLPDDVKELIGAARAAFEGVAAGTELWNDRSNRVLRAVRALDGKY